MRMSSARHDKTMSCAYGLYASVAYVAKSEMSAVLPTIIARILESVTSKEGISLECRKDDVEALGGSLAIEELEADDCENEDDEILFETEGMGKSQQEDLDLEGFDTIRVENSFMEEKEQATLSLKDICRHVGPLTFSPYLSQSISETWNLLDYPDEDVSKAAVSAVGVFAMAFYKLAMIGAGFNAKGEFERYILDLVPKLSQMIKEDEHVSVVFSHQL